VEYSIKWSILLHIINNFLLAEVLTLATSGLNEQMQEMIENIIIFVFFLLGAVFVWRNRSPIKEYALANREPRKKYLYVLTAIMMIVFMVAETAVAISQLTPL